MEKPEQPPPAPLEWARCAHLLCKHTKSRNPMSRRTNNKITISKDEAMTEIVALREVIMNASDKEAKFMELAKERSDCGSYRAGGDLGNFDKGMMEPPFEEATFALEIGQVSEVVDTKAGLHLILRLPLDTTD